MRARVLFNGSADAVALVLTEPLSLWGGLDPQTGELTDVHHPQHGAHLSGRVIVMSSSRGSSSSSSVLAEAVRAGHAPAAIVLGQPDLILAVGAAVAAELYDEHVPVLVLRAEDRDAIHDGMRVRIRDGGEITLD
jgi:predicted aconitase with swiveling domain